MHLTDAIYLLNRVNLYSLDLFADDMDGRQGIIDLSIGLYPKMTEDDGDQVFCSQVFSQCTL